MSNRIYRSARGTKIDMGDLMLRNEDVRAVGNMGVNAKGDKIDNKGTVTKTRNQQVNKTYRKQIANQVTDVPPAPNTLTTAQQSIVNDEPVAEVEGLDTKLVVEEPVVEESVTVEEMDQTVKETAVENFKQSVVEEVVEKESVIEEVAEEPVVEAPKPKATPKKKKAGGLAGAIAKAREVEQKKLKTAKEEAKSKKGVKKI